MTVVIVGGGKMGLSHLAIASRLLGRASIALCDSSLPMRLVYSRLGVKVYKSLDAALTSGGIEGVIVSTPTGSHYSIAREAIGRSIPCFIEKPLTLDVLRSRELERMASERQVPVQMGFVLRYTTSFLRLRQVVESGRLGRVTGYRASMFGNVITAPDTRTWRADFSRGGGCLNEYGPHLIDLSRFIFGDVSSVDSASYQRVHSSRADDKVSFDWRHAAGQHGRVIMDWCDPTRRKSVVEFDVEFEAGRVFSDNSSFFFEARSGAGLSALDMAELSAPVVPPRVSYYLRGEEYSLQLEDFLERCTGRRYRVDTSFSPDRGATLRDGVAVDELISTIAKLAGLA